VNGATATYDLTAWRLRVATDGERNGWSAPDLDDTLWSDAQIPLDLPKGALVWYRTSFPTAAVLRENFDAPLSLLLMGRNAKATLWFNGRLIGRWLSDEEWICRGTWTRCLRSMWSVNDPDAIPLAEELLSTDDSPNELTILFEDTSADTDPTGGRIDTLRIDRAAEELTPDGETSALRALPRRTMTLHPTE